MDPSVTMNDGTRSRDTYVPTMAPQPVAKAIARTAASASGTPAFTKRAIKTVVSATSEPTERSMPPVTMIMVIPTAQTATTAVSWKMMATALPSANTGVPPVAWR